MTILSYIDDSDTRRTIEVAPKDYWFSTPEVDNAKIYCFMLDLDNKNDWSLPQPNDLSAIYREFGIGYSGIGWDTLDMENISNTGDAYMVYPVREVS